MDEDQDVRPSYTNLSGDPLSEDLQEAVQSAVDASESLEGQAIRDLLEQHQQTLASYDRALSTHPTDQVSFAPQGHLVGNDPQAHYAAMQAIASRFPDDSLPGWMTDGAAEKHARSIAQALEDEVRSQNRVDWKAAFEDPEFRSVSNPDAVIMLKHVQRVIDNDRISVSDDSLLVQVVPGDGEAAGPLGSWAVYDARLGQEGIYVDTGFVRLEAALRAAETHFRSTIGSEDLAINGADRALTQAIAFRAYFGMGGPFSLNNVTYRQISEMEQISGAIPTTLGDPADLRRTAWTTSEFDPPCIEVTTADRGLPTTFAHIELEDGKWSGLVAGKQLGMTDDLGTALEYVDKAMAEAGLSSEVVPGRMSRQDALEALADTAERHVKQDRSIISRARAALRGEASLNEWAGVAKAAREEAAAGVRDSYSAGLLDSYAPAPRHEASWQSMAQGSLSVAMEHDDAWIQAARIQPREALDGLVSWDVMLSDGGPLEHYGTFQNVSDAVNRAVAKVGEAGGVIDMDSLPEALGAAASSALAAGANAKMQDAAQQLGTYQLDLAFPSGGNWAISVAGPEMGNWAPEGSWYAVAKDGPNEHVRFIGSYNDVEGAVEAVREDCMASGAEFDQDKVLDNLVQGFAAVVSDPELGVAEPTAAACGKALANLADEGDRLIVEKAMEAFKYAENRGAFAVDPQAVNRCEQLSREFDAYTKSQLSGRGAAPCPLGSIDACAKEMEKLAPAAGKAGSDALAELNKSRAVLEKVGCGLAAPSEAKGLAHVDAR